MAETKEPGFVDSPYTLRQLIIAAYRGKFKDRYDNAERDVKKRARVETVTQWKVKYAAGIPERYKVHNYRIKVVSIKPDGTVSNYPVVILLDYLSPDAKVKVRCGGLFEYSGRGTMKDKRICGDFHFRFMNVLRQHGVLFNRDSTNKKAPVITNPTNEIGLCKHIWGAIADLVQSNFLGEAGVENAENNAELIERL